jgi:multiple sugar transport system substrate-binding protein
MNPAIDGLTRRGFLRAAGGTALAVGAGGALTACGGGGDSGGSATKELSFVYMGTAEQQATWNKLFAKFGEQHPEIKLKAEGIPLSNWGDFFNKLSTRLAGGQVPDVIQVATEGQRLFASKGLLAPLDDYIGKDKSVIDEYYADMDANLIEWNKKYSSTDGKTYYLPGEFNTMCMWYSKDLFAKAGSAYLSRRPSGPGTTSATRVSGSRPRPAPSVTRQTPRTSPRSCRGCSRTVRAASMTTGPSRCSTIPR